MVYERVMMLFTLPSTNNPTFRVYVPSSENGSVVPLLTFVLAAVGSEPSSV